MTSSLTLFAIAVNSAYRRAKIERCHIGTVASASIDYALDDVSTPLDRKRDGHEDGSREPRRGSAVKPS